MQHRQEAPRGQGVQPLALRLNDLLGRIGLAKVRDKLKHALAKGWKEALVKRKVAREDGMTLRRGFALKLVSTVDATEALHRQFEVDVRFG